MASNNARDVLKEGWLFKKRRKKSQGILFIDLPSISPPPGFASRYFKLHSSGLLSYSIHPSISPRDQILLSSAVISSFSTSPCDVHIDSDFSTFHIKFKTVAESQQWMPFFRKFIKGTISRPTEYPKRPEDIVRVMEQVGSSLTFRSLLGCTDILQSIHELNRSLSALKQEELSLKSPNFFKFKRDREGPSHSTGKSKDKDNRLNRFFKSELRLAFFGIIYLHIYKMILPRHLRLYHPIKRPKAMGFLAWIG
jgi:oxysterol-binding protein-related protein 3/6/7